MNYPDYKTYEILYARYLKEDRVKQLLSLAGDLKSQVILDCCCGNGRLTKSALSRKNKVKKVIMIDNEMEMIPHTFWGNKKIEIKIGTVKEKLEQLIESESDNETQIDVVICQQGINYWLNKTTVKLLSMIVEYKGIFIFNTFNEEPSKTPQIKQYRIKDRNYIEVSWKVKNKYFDVQHVQICSGLPPHFTSFKWLSEDYIRECLNKYFDIEIIKDGKTDIYKCVKKDQSNE